MPEVSTLELASITSAPLLLMLVGLGIGAFVITLIVIGVAFFVRSTLRTLP